MGRILGDFIKFLDEGKIIQHVIIFFISHSLRDLMNKFIKEILNPVFSKKVPIDEIKKSDWREFVVAFLNMCIVSFLLYLIYRYSLKVGRTFNIKIPFTE